MRKFSRMGVALVTAIALYFAFAWGSDAVQMLTSQSYGLDDVWRSQFVFVIGSIAGLGPVGLIKLAAFFAALKLAVAGVCALHVLDRARVYFGVFSGKADPEIFEGALILVVLVSIVAVGPAVSSQNVDLVREGLMQLVLAAVATALCLIERGKDRSDKKAEANLTLSATPRGAPWYAPFR